MYVPERGDVITIVPVWPEMVSKAHEGRTGFADTVTASLSGSLAEGNW